MCARIKIFLLFISGSLGSFLSGPLYAAVLTGYVTGGPSYIVPDADRHVENAVGLKIGVGLSVHPAVSLEFSVTHDSLKQEIGNESYHQNGWQLDGLYHFGHSAHFSPYGVVGGGVLESEFMQNKKLYPLLNGGIGIRIPLVNNRLFLQGDWRYRYGRAINALGTFQKDQFRDPIVHVMLMYPWGQKESVHESVQTPVLETPLQPIPKRIPPPIQTPVAKQDSKPISKSDSESPFEPFSEPQTRAPAPTVKDQDSDLIPDNRDRCPNTILGANVDTYGCELDHDSDGVVNSQDRCPDSPPGTAVDESGCTLKTKSDTDHDGVPESSDLCPGTRPLAIVNTSGCDAEGETLLQIEQIKKCLQFDTHETNIGCEIPESFILGGIEFAKGSDRLPPDAKTVLNAIAELLIGNPDIVVEIAGYTDNQGSTASNIMLSRKRAEAISNDLIRQGVLAANLITNGYGPEKPIADNNTPQGQAQNRRIEIHILGR